MRGENVVQLGCHGRRHPVTVAGHLLALGSYRPASAASVRWNEGGVQSQGEPAHGGVEGSAGGSPAGQTRPVPPRLAPTRRVGV